MIFSATGIVVDHYGDVLLIKRDDTQTLAPPGGAANIGELPPDTVAREVREETGLIVMAVRLVGLYYLPTQPNDYLSLCFRCIMRGGEITTSEESPHVGFFKANPLPKPMLNLHQERIQRSLAHQGGPPYWGSNMISTRLRLGNMLINRVIYPWLHFRRRRAGQSQYIPPPSWQTRSTVIIYNNQGQILWIKDQDTNRWILPGGVSKTKEPPWKTAVRCTKTTVGLSGELNGLSGVYPSPDEPEVAFSFTGKATSNPGQSPVVETAYFAPGNEPVEAQPQHTSFVKDATENGEQTVFRHLDTVQDRRTGNYK